MSCNLCPELSANRSRIVRGTHVGSELPKVAVIGEAPGRDEDWKGEPFIGASGEELRHFLRVNGIMGRGVYLDNVCMCRPPGNRTPNVSEIRNCTENFLIPKLLTLQPKWIITVGKTASEAISGTEISIEMEHGIPRPLDFYGMPVIHIPTYHPAAGLHDPSKMLLFMGDMRAAGNVIKGKISPRPPCDEFAGQETYEIMDKPMNIGIGDTGFVAVDTEWAKGGPYLASVSTEPGVAWVIRESQRDVLDRLHRDMNLPNVTTGVHNILYDLPVLAKMGITPLKPACSMSMAYLLQDEPQGLKPLAYRYCGMKMASYKDMVGGATEELALSYILDVLSKDWPNPSPVLEWKKGEPHVRQPQNIGRKAARILKGGVDLSGKWKAVKEGKEIVEAELGPLVEGELCDIPEEDAVFYSARDADATIRIFPILWERILSLDLDGTFWRDMRSAPMIIDMMANGMLIDQAEFARLSKYFQGKMESIQRKIQMSVGHLLDNKDVNPGSSMQMAELIYDKLHLDDKVGQFKAKKGGSKRSTGAEVLKRYEDHHPVVKKIMDWRGYQKLKTTYADAIPKLVSQDGRIRTTLRMTRVITGRLASSKPNLMAQPVRSEEGRLIRDCYIAEKGNVLVSGDYAAVEMKVVASESRDKRMMEVFLSGGDLHAQTASDMFGIPLSQVDAKKHRYPAKRVGFGILYMITAQGLQRELVASGVDCTVRDCEEMIKSWFKIYSGVAKYMKENGIFAKRHGFVRDMWGRIRFVPGIKSTNRWTRMEAERQAGNAPIQMGAQGVIKEAMGRLVPVYRELEGVKPLLQIHDDILWEMPEYMTGIAIPRISKVLETSVPKGFRIPLTVDFQTSKRWGSLEKWKS